jgi:hypothetical protein
MIFWVRGFCWISFGFGCGLGNWITGRRFNLCKAGWVHIYVHVSFKIRCLFLSQLISLLRLWVHLRI